MSRRLRGWLGAAGLLAALSLGLPWSGLTTGADSPSRVAIVLAAFLVCAGLRTGRDRLLPLAGAVGVIGVLWGGLAPSPGRLALAAAVGCLVTGLRADGRPLLARNRRARSPSAGS